MTWLISAALTGSRFRTNRAGRIRPRLAGLRARTVKIFLDSPRRPRPAVGQRQYQRGAKVYAENCAACHGDKLEGNPAKGIGGDKLIGGRGSLATKSPVKTVESYWPYATTLFDYIKRSMPFSAPGTLKDEEVYAVVAYILSEAKIIKPTDTMDATTLPKVLMPNRDGFIPDARPELDLYK